MSPAVQILATIGNACDPHRLRSSSAACEPSAAGRGLAVRIAELDPADREVLRHAVRVLERLNQA